MVRLSASRVVNSNAPWGIISDQIGEEGEGRALRMPRYRTRNTRCMSVEFSMQGGEGTGNVDA